MLQNFRREKLINVPKSNFSLSTLGILIYAIIPIYYIDDDPDITDYYYNFDVMIGEEILTIVGGTKTAIQILDNPNKKEFKITETLYFKNNSLNLNISIKGVINIGFPQIIQN